MPFSTRDTIAAVATPPGRGGIGVVRVSGPGALSIAAQLITHHGPLEPRHATLTKIAGHSSADVVDHVVATYFPGPASYTGDDVVELSAHGSPVILNSVVAAAVANGARLAEPGEFTLRAFLNGRIDLMQAEAVGDLIDAATPLQARAAFDQLDGTLTRTIGEIDAALFDLIARLEASIDFPDEGYHFVEPDALAREIDALLARTTKLLADGRRGRLIREGLRVVIVGEPNVGKSSLFNALVGAPRAIVTEVPGTTRDLVTEVVDIAGLRITLADTAGLHDTDDPVEVLGVERSRRSAAVADLVLTVVDRSACRDLNIEYKGLVVANKADLRPAWDDPSTIAVSATTGAGLDELRRRIANALDADLLCDRPAITNVRQIALVDRAHSAMTRGRAAALDGGQSMPEEFVLADLLEARCAFEEITGRRTSEDVLEHIFARFCIGK
jgi:tRNA modification GTPase